MARSTATAAPELTKAQRFQKLGSQRTAKAIKAIRNIGNLTNKRSYEWTDEQVAKIISSLAEEVAAVKARFESGAPAKDEFEL